MTPTQSIASPRLFLRSALIAEGISSDDIQRRRRRREWIALKPGVYVGTQDIKSLDDRQRHVLLVAATLPGAPDDAVLSHLSAACLHGFNLWQPTLRAVQVTRPGSGGGHRRRSLHTFRASLDDDEVISLNGHRVTSPARTVVDLARLLPFEAAVCAADAALHDELTTFDELTAAVTRARRRPGMCGAREVINFSEARTESVGESRSRVAIWKAGLPRPEPQYRVRTAAGHVLARSDFGWEEFRTVGEFDGAQKYGRLLRHGEPPGDRIYQEKLREDRIRDAGFQVVRWTWDELDHWDIVADRITRTLERGRRRA